MAEEKFEYKSEEKPIRSSTDPLDVSITNGLECVWNCKVTKETQTGAVLHFSWKFNWDELKKKGIERLSGYIHVKPPSKIQDCNCCSDDSVEEYCDDFSSRKFNIDLNEPNQVIRCEIWTKYLFGKYLGMFEYSLIPQYTQIDEVKKDSSAEQNGTVSAIEEKKNDDVNEKVISDGIVLAIWKKMFLPSEQRDALLVIDGRKIHVNKWFLSYHSEFFRNLFMLDCMTGKVNEIPIGGISYDDFLLLLGPISSKPVFPTDKTVEKLLELATLFKMTSVIDHCEYYLIHLSKMETEKKMWISEKYGLSELLEKSILEMDTMEKVKKWKQTPEYNLFSDNTKARVLDRLT